jgi:hypothetical protein
MKNQNKDKSPKVAKPAAAALVAMEPMWNPSWKWHAKTLGIIYVCLVVVYFAVSYLLSRVPPPYKLREVPKELTPWLGK